MGTGSTPDIDVDPAAFVLTYDAELVATKQNFDNAGNLRGPLPTSLITSQHTAEWGNLIDDLIRSLQAASRGAARIGTAGDLSVDHGAVASWSAGASRVLLRNAANSAYVPMQATSYLFDNGAQLSSGSGDPNGSITHARGSLRTDADTGEVYAKTTASGPSGWALVGSGGVIVDNMGWTASSISPYYLPIGSGVAESGTLNMQHIWRAPATGTITNMRIVCTNDPGNSTFSIYESDGTTLLDTDGQTSSTFTFGVGTGYLLDFTGIDQAVTEGDLICFELDPATGTGQAAAFLELSL